MANMTSILYLLTLVDEEERGPCRIHTCPFTGEMKVEYCLDGNSSVIYDKVRMDADIFIQLSDLLEGWGLLHTTQHMSVDAQLIIFLSIIAKGYNIGTLLICGSNQMKLSLDILRTCWRKYACWRTHLYGLLTIIKCSSCFKRMDTNIYHGLL